MGKTSSRLLMAALAVAAIFMAGAFSGAINPFTSTNTFAVGGMMDDDQPLTGADLEKATAAALRHTGGGVVTDSERGDDGAAYSVEVRLPNGSQVEVNLDANFNVTGQELDDDGPDDSEDDDGSDDD